MRTQPTTLRRRLGYTLAETMISLSITAALLAAMGGAFTAAGSAIEVNDRYFRAVQQGRSGMNLVMTEIRRAQAITNPTTRGACTSITFTPGPLTNPDFSGHSLTIAYDSTNQWITLTDNTASPTQTMTLASNVTNAQFIVDTGSTYPSGSAVSSISLSMTIGIKGEAITLSDSAAPRINCVALYQ
jgi:type II secretory pathway pseudopilin PulG